MRLRAVLIVVCLAIAPATARGQSPAGDDLARARARLIEATRDYRASLERLRALQESAASRAMETLRRRRALLEEGVVSRLEVQVSEQAEARAREQIEGTRRRLVESDAVLSETLAVVELAKLPPVSPAVPVTAPAVLREPGAQEFAIADLAGIERFFRARFGRMLPVSALGQTLTHARLGLDHRDAVDVALHPDSDEGRELIDHLRAQSIPFLAFRGVIPGASTGAHVHIGRASERRISTGRAHP